MSRNRNNSMEPMSNIRDDYYKNGPTPAVFNENHVDKCLFENDSYKKATADNTINYDTGINSIQQMNFRQDQYKNSKLIDNNINHIPKEDITKEITLVVDSIDRDMDTYPNSFNFRVRFNPSSSDKQPYINKKLENIKSVNLQAIILPNYYKLEKISVDQTTTTLDDDIITILNNSLTPTTDTEFNSTTTPVITGNIIIISYNGSNPLTIDFFDTNDALKHEKVYSAVVDTTAGFGNLTTAHITDFSYYTYKISNPIKICNDRYIKLEIDELKDIDDYSTDVYRGHSFGTLYQDGVQCNSNICYMTSISDIEFPNSNLKNISSLTINLYSSVGEALNSTGNKNTNITNKTKVNEYINGNIKYVSASRYIRHPLYLYSQCHFIFKITYIEPNLNKINFN